MTIWFLPTKIIFSENLFFICDCFFTFCKNFRALFRNFLSTNFRSMHTESTVNSNRRADANKGGMQPIMVKKCCRQQQYKAKDVWRCIYIGSYCFNDWLPLFKWLLKLRYSPRNTDGTYNILSGMHFGFSQTTI